MKGMESILENTGIGKIAKDITDELDLENMLSGEGGMEGLFKGENMMNIFLQVVM